MTTLKIIFFQTALLCLLLRLAALAIDVLTLVVHVFRFINLEWKFLQFILIINLKIIN